MKGYDKLALCCMLVLNACIFSNHQNLNHQVHCLFLVITSSASVSLVVLELVGLLLEVLELPDRGSLKRNVCYLNYFEKSVFMNKFLFGYKYSKLA